MDIGTFVFFGFLWFLFNLLRRGGQTGSAPKQGQGPTQSRPLPPASTGDATQREGSRLEGLLRDLNRSLEEAARAQQTKAEAEQAEARAARKAEAVADEEEIEERESLEVPETVISLETEVARPQRTVVTRDELAARIAARRVETAAARDKALTPADHRQFDKQIRQEPADHTAVARYTPRQLRDAVMWREILGPPVALRQDSMTADSER